MGGAFLLTGCAALALPKPAEAHPGSSIEVGGALIAEAVFGGPVAVGGLIKGLHHGSVAAGVR